MLDTTNSISASTNDIEKQNKQSFVVYIGFDLRKILNWIHSIRIDMRGLGIFEGRLLT